MILRKRIATAILIGAFAFSAIPVFGQTLVKPESAERIGMQSFWHANAPMPAAEFATRATLVDDNIYLISPSNIVVAVHAGTGVVRWVTRVADPGQTVVGPTHSENFAFFTGPGSVKVVDRRTGQPAEQPRKLRGVVITVAHDVAEISLGRAHGVRLDDVLDVISASGNSARSTEAFARIKITVIGDRTSKGRILQDERTERVRSGDRIWGDIGVPIDAVKLPFAPASPAVANDEDMFVGAANERMYSIRFLSGFQNWQVSTPGNMSAAAVLHGGNLYFCDLDGRCAAATQRRRERIFEFQTEGAIFLSPVVTEDHVLVASNDRSLYCLQRIRMDDSPRRAGDRVWQHRFDDPPEKSPVASGDLVFHRTSAGLFAVSLEDGAEKWNRPGSAEFLARMDDEAYLWESAGRKLIRVKVKDGEEVGTIDIPSADFAMANVENQLVIVGTRDGRMTCLRPKDAPYLRPSQLALVLQNDEKARRLNTLLADAKQKREAEAAARAEAARPAERPAYSFLDDDDWLISTSNRMPVGTRNVVGEDGKLKPKAVKKPKKVKEDVKPKPESKEDEEDVWDDDEEKKDDEKKDKDADDEDSEDDSDDDDDW